MIITARGRQITNAQLHQVGTDQRSVRPAAGLGNKNLHSTAQHMPEAATRIFVQHRDLSTNEGVRWVCSSGNNDNRHGNRHQPMIRAAASARRLLALSLATGLGCMQTQTSIACCAQHLRHSGYPAACY